MSWPFNTVLTVHHKTSVLMLMWLTFLFKHLYFDVYIFLNLTKIKWFLYLFVFFFFGNPLTSNRDCHGRDCMVARFTYATSRYQLYRGGWFYWWRISQCPEKTTDVLCCKSLLHIMLYRAHIAWGGFEAMTLVVIGTDCISTYLCM